jgi:tRNA(Arg) A34 adenosine deaminase TadA
MTTTTTTTTDPSSPFVEILRPQPPKSQERFITAYAISIPPKECSSLCKRLAQECPLSSNLLHLKRVRNPSLIHKKNKSSSSPPNKKSKILLQVLIGTDDTQTEYGPLIPVQVPGRPPSSPNEHAKFTDIWPTTYLPLNTPEHFEQQNKLQQKEIMELQKLMDTIVIPNNQVLVVTSDFQVVSNSYNEEEEQSMIANNPLATPIILALQGVSRLERQNANTLSLQTFQKGQYLCTGYDVLSPHPPTVFESMACLHHRIRRFFFYQQQNQSSIQTHGLSKHYIHNLPGTNHRYRAFEYQLSNMKDSEQSK